MSLATKIAGRVRANAVACRGTVQGFANGITPLPYFGAVGIRNLGDELLLAIARESFPGRSFVPLDTRHLLQRQLLRLSSSNATSMLVGGGTLLLSEALLRTLEDAIEHGMRFCTFGTGAHDPRFFGSLSPDSTQAWRDVLTCSDALGVRGPQSVTILQALGVAHARTVGDPAVVFSTFNSPALRGGRSVGLNVGTAHGAVWGGAEEPAIEALTQTAVTLRRAGWSVRLFSVWPPDTRVARRIARDARLGDHAVVAEYHNPFRMIAAITTCDLFVGMKLHSQILAICAGVPTIAIEYQPKTVDFMQSIESTSEVVRIDSLTVSQLHETVESLALVREEVALRQWGQCRALAAAFGEYVAAIGGSYDHLLAYLEERPH